MCQTRSSERLLLLLFSLSIVSQTFCLQTSFVDPGVISVPQYEGWGTSLAWWPDMLGGHNEDVVDFVTDAFFSPDKLNLNIVRYTIGGTTFGITTCGEYRPGAATESYRNSPNEEYNWERDPRQRRILFKAKELGVDTFEAFSNSPPDCWNVTFTTFAPFNEPFGLGGIGGWMGPGLTKQEGCNMARATMVEVVKSVYQGLNEKNMGYVHITTADETQVDTATGTQNIFRNSEVSSLTEKVNVHGYWDQTQTSNRRDLLRRAAQLDSHRLWMDEMGWPKSPLNDMTQGLEIATRIIRDFKRLLPSAWIYWQVMEDIDEWSLLGVPYINATVDSIEYHSGYFAMLQFSKYIKKGYSIIHANNHNTIAAFGNSSSELVLVLVNSENAVMASTFDLYLFSPILPSSISATRTSESEQNAAIATPIVVNNAFTYYAPEKSVSTFLIRNISASLRQNMVLNPDFEKDEMEGNAWQVEVIEGSLSSGKIDNSLVWEGHCSGHLEVSTDPVAFSQSLRATTNSSEYYLTAWCYSNGPNAKLGVKINGIAGPEVQIQSRLGFQAYGLKFNANEGDDIYIYFIISSGVVHIDNVALHATTVTVNEGNNSANCSELFKLYLYILLLSCLFMK